jgi:hypothetical protein
MSIASWRFGFMFVPGGATVAPQVHHRVRAPGSPCLGARGQRLAAERAAIVARGAAQHQVVGRTRRVAERAHRDVPRGPWPIPATRPARGEILERRSVLKSTRPSSSACAIVRTVSARGGSGRCW